MEVAKKVIGVIVGLLALVALQVLFRSTAEQGGFMRILDSSEASGAFLGGLTVVVVLGAISAKLLLNNWRDV